MKRGRNEEQRKIDFVDHSKCPIILMISTPCEMQLRLPSAFLDMGVFPWCAHTQSDDRKTQSQPE